MTFDDTWESVSCWGMVPATGQAHILMSAAPKNVVIHSNQFRPATAIRAYEQPSHLEGRKIVVDYAD